MMSPSVLALHSPEMMKSGRLEQDRRKTCKVGIKINLYSEESGFFFKVTSLCLFDGFISCNMLDEMLQADILGV